MTLPQLRCYRHADRSAGVACQRCDRPICVDCMIQASVGFQCPNCARAAQQTVVRPAARWTGGGSMQRPVVTLALIVVNVVAYAYSLTLPDGSFSGQLIGRLVIPGVIDVGVGEGEWWRLITGGFLHGSPMHLAFNMFALWALGEGLERVLGPARFAAAYGASLLAGSFGVMLVSPNSPTVGASGAVFGLFGVMLAFQLSRGIPLGQTRLGLVLIINLGFTFLVPGISIGGHLGGLMGGILVGAGWFGVPRAHHDPPLAVGWAVTAGLAVMSFAGSIAVAAAAPPW
jgi:membrane associated rhomboid family serine protease